jgi:hypothetical protein
MGRRPEVAKKCGRGEPMCVAIHKCMVGMLIGTSLL